MTKYRKSLLYGLLFCLLVATFAVYDVRTGYVRETSAVRARVANTSFLLAEWIRSAFVSSDYVLRDVVSQVTVKELLNIKQEVKTTQFLRSKLETLPSYFKEIGVANEHCIATSAYTVPPIPTFIGMDGSNREWCKVFKNTSKTDSHTTQMFRGSSGTMVVSQGYPLRTSSGKLKGIAGLVVELDFFSTWLEKLTTDEHSILAITDINISLLARTPALPEALGEKVNDEIVEAFIASGENYKDFRNKSPLDGENRFYGVRKVDGLPFIVVVGEAEQDWLNGWQIRTWATVISVFLLWGMAIQILRHHWKQLDQQKNLSHQAQTDPLTKVLNRRGFMEKAEREFKRSQRHQTDLAVLVLDVDLFKIINDKNGHATGDRALIVFSQECLKIIRDIDVLGRMGGDEFAILLPNTTSEKALIVAERIRLAIETSEALNDDNVPVLMTSSIGVAVVGPEITSVSDLLALADKALYLSKENGRNCVDLCHK